MTDTQGTSGGLARFVFISLMVAGAASWRLLAYAFPAAQGQWAWWNFAPVAAIAFFAGMKFTSRWAAFAVPFAAMALSDVVLHANGWAPLKTPADWINQSATYMVFALMVGAGLMLRNRASIPVIFAGTLAGAVLFFVVSNFVVWLTVTLLPNEGMPQSFRYAFTFAGLKECYAKALPFFRGTLAGDLIWSTLLFGSHALVERSHLSTRRGAVAENRAF